MRFDLIPLQEFIKNNAKTPTKDIIKDFKVKINEFLSQASKVNEEDYQKKEISIFLEKTYNYKTNIKGNKNNFIKFIIICTAKDFFIIDAKEYKKPFC
ncbi:hypothetical protein G5F52_001031 [Campylobacter lari]|nr:hypothetical protein [Campylobacter lari]